ncbi:hypothetical protein Tsubulata_019997 [Turnera subulata]|uniref:TF-B3 domain-containing protein n=1 Tax=Turnera subulata TaxID=218843 RepID=A0A9Q0FXG9_9ROSI|nr:hypothetical protein Tsubulata_019997 [Turnera subulata]
MIPPMFTRKYGKDLPSTVILIVPTGATWRVELVRCGAEIWLQNGWKEFADYYSLTYGHLLLFQYKGNYDFHVLIFDRSATEIEYPLGSLHRDEQGFQDQEVEESETDISIEIIEERLFSGRSDVASKPSNKKQKPSKTESASKMQPMSSVQKARALSRASAFKSTNPFFKIVKQPSCVHGGSRMNLVYFLAGWKEFVEDNNLGVGDVCVFEMINEKYMMFHVYIFRHNDEDANCPLPAATGLQKKKRIVIKDMEGRVWPVEEEAKRLGLLEHRVLCFSES